MLPMAARAARQDEHLLLALGTRQGGLCRNMILMRSTLVTSGHCCLSAT
jgi:hypothetical protein